MGTLSTSERQILEWIDEMTGRFDAYEVERDEYLADYSLSPQTFAFYTDVVLPFCTNTLIMDNIAAAEEANYPPDNASRNRLSIHFFYKGKAESVFREISAIFPLLRSFVEEEAPKEIDYPSHFPYLVRTIPPDGSSTPLRLKEAFRDVQVKFDDGSWAPDPLVSLPSTHTLYSILENIIRNSAKHNAGDNVADNGIKVFLHLEELANPASKDVYDRYLLTISDDVSRKDALNLMSGNPEAPGIFERMIVNPEDDQSARRANLGFFDMQVNSFLLRYRGGDLKKLGECKNLALVSCSGDTSRFLTRRISPEPVDHEERRGPLFPNSTPEPYSFGYQMVLLKPKTIFWIGEWISQIDMATCKGIRVQESLLSLLQELDLNANRTELSSLEEIACYDFVVIADEFDFDEYLTYQNLLPPRVIVLSEHPHPNATKPNLAFVNRQYFKDCVDETKLSEACWQAWLGRSGKGIDGYIYYSDSAKSVSSLENVHGLGDRLSLESANATSGGKEEFPQVGRDRTIVLYDHHGGYESNNGRFESPGEEHNFFLEHSRILFEKSSDDFLLLNKLGLNSERDRTLAYRILDAATTNVFVLDERIAALALQRLHSTDNDKPIGLQSTNWQNAHEDYAFSRLCYGKVFVVTDVLTRNKHAPVLAHNNTPYKMELKIYDPVIVSVEEAGSNRMFEGVNEKLGKDILLMHRTFLNEDKMGIPVGELLNALNRYFGSVVVTSGGGAPAILESLNQRFIPFSIIQKCLAGRLAKIKLVTELQSLVYV